METALRRKLYVVGGLMPPDEISQIREAIGKLSAMPREFAIFLEGFSREVSAHVIGCARRERAEREKAAQYWRANDRRQPE